MEDDEKTTARTKSGEPVRTTAPAGTPARRSPPEQAHALAPSGPGRSPSDRPLSDRPLDTLTPPRTVGGRTARLLDEAPRARARAPQPEIRALSEPSHDSDFEPPSAPLQSTGRTVGGNTMKLATVDQIPQHEAAVVGGAAMQVGPRTPQNGKASPAPAPAPAAAQAPAAPAPQPSAAPLPGRSPTGPAPTPAAPPVTSDAEDDLSVFASPLAVAVGIVSLALGSILTLTVGRRWVLPEPAAAAGELRAPIAPPEPTTAAPAAPAAPTTARTAAAATTPAATTPAAVATEAPPAATPATTMKPQAPRGPAAGPKPTGKRPIFDLPGH